MKTTIRKCCTLLLCLSLMMTLGATAYGTYLPGVTAEMSSPAYWSEKQDGADEVLMSMDEIAAQNARNIAASGTEMHDLKNQPETFDGIAQRENLARSGQSDAEYYLGWTYDRQGNKVDESFYEKMIQNMQDPDASEEQPVKYAVAVNRTTLHSFPSNEPILDDPADPDFDYQHQTGVRVNEPLVIFGRSADGAFYLVRSVCCPGWVPAEDIAICKDKEEWLQAWDFAPENTLVVWGAYTTASSNFAPQISRRLLTQGTVLECVELEDRNELVNNRAAYNSYVVWMPVRNEDGSYARSLCLIAESAQVSRGYLPLTKTSLARVAFSLLGDMYGWGGMLMADDCSGYIRNVYKCFGLELARNTGWQAAMPVYYQDLTGMSVEKKTAVIRKLPLGATLFMKGHEMMYLGCVDDKLYVVNSSSSIMNPDVDGKRQRSRTVMINTLDVKRTNGNTWLADLTGANVPYCPADGQPVKLPEMQDVSADSWYYDAVQWALLNDVTGGTAEDTFSPDQNCTRAQMVTFLWRASGMPEPSAAENPFTDVTEKDYCYKAVQWAVEKQITSGTSETTFSPEDFCTRGQSVTFLHRFGQMPVPEALPNPFRDVAEDAYYYNAVQWAVQADITNGTSEDTFSPEEHCTRAQIVTLLYRNQNQNQIS